MIPKKISMEIDIVRGNLFEVIARVGGIKVSACETDLKVAFGKTIDYLEHEWDLKLEKNKQKHINMSISTK